MEKFESKPNIKKPDATQLDLNFEDTSKKLDVEEEKEFIKEDIGNEYFGRFNKYRNKEIPSLPKRAKTQREKDDAKRRAILKALKKRENKGYTTGYEHHDPWDMSR